MPQFGFSIQESEIAPGTTGALMEDQPKLTTAHVRPFVWATLMYRTGVHSWEVVNALSAICSTQDTKIDDFDEDERTWLEICVDTALAEMVIEGLLRYNEKKDVWVLAYSPSNVPTVIKAVSGVNGSMPKHFLLEMAQEARQ
jgi:hypothetical protein